MRDPCSDLDLSEFLAAGCSFLTARIPLLRHAAMAAAPVRLFSRLLIISLILVSPLSFSTDRIPNICPDYSFSNSTLESKVEQKQPAAYVISKQKKRTLSYRSAASPFSTSPYTSNHHPSDNHNRAPPLTA